MRTRVKVLIAGVVVMAVVSGAWVWKSTQRTATGSSINIAANLPISGPLGIYGSSVRDGANFALERSKSDGNPNLRFDWQDNAGDPRNAVTIFQKQILDNPSVYISGIKPQTMAIAGQVTQRGLPHFVWIFDARINENSSNNFRTYVNYKIEAQAYLDYAAKRNAKRVSIVYVQLPHTIDQFNRLVIPGLKDKGVADIQVEAYDFGRSDFRDIAAKVKAFNPDLIILNGFVTELVAAVRGLRPLSLVADGNTIGTFDMADAAKVLGADEIEGIRVTAPVFTTRPQAEPVASWAKAFKERFKRDPSYTDAFGYDMALVLNDSARRVGAKAVPAEWIRAIRATDIPGITGQLKFDSDGDLITPIEIGVFRGGVLTPDTQAK